MKILVDINHPAHVHFFRHLVLHALERGDEVVITASEKDVALTLLRAFEFPFISIGTYGRSKLVKLLRLPLLTWRMLMVVRRHKPDVLLGIASFRAAQAGWLMRRPVLVFDDTEHSVFEIMMYRPFARAIYSPDCFRKQLGSKHVLYPGYHELAYLHSSRFRPDAGIWKELGLSEGSPYVIMRFVGWAAFHDRGKSGLTYAMKLEAVKAFEKHATVFISSEAPLPAELEAYKMKLPPHRMHQAMYHASLVFGEGATMASEAACLGTPNIYFDSFGMGYTKELEDRYGSIISYSPTEADMKSAIRRGVEILVSGTAKKEWQSRREDIMRDKKDVTLLMTDWVCKHVQRCAE